MIQFEIFNYGGKLRKERGCQTMVTFEIFFKDLTAEAQSRLCQEFKTSPEEENWDVFPIAIIEREFEE